MKKYVKDKAIVLFGTIMLVLASLWDIVYQFTLGRKLIDSDMASEMVLANILNEERSIVSSNWYYANELRVFSVQWFYRIGLLFSKNWTIARTIGFTFMLTLLIFFTILLFREIDCKEYGIWMTALLVLPFGRKQVALILRNSYYIVLYINAMLLLWLLMRYIHKEQKRYLLLMILPAICSGINGIRGTMVLYVPVCFASVIYFFADNLVSQRVYNSMKEYWTNNATILRLILAGGVALASDFVGVVIGFKFIGPSIDFVSNNIDFDWANCYNYLHDVLRGYLIQFGFESGVKLLSLRGILLCGFIVVSLIIVCAAFRLAFIFKNLSRSEQYIYCVYCASITVCCFVFIFIGNYHSTYWLPLIPVTFVILGIWVKNEKFSMKFFNDAIVVILAIAFLMVSTQAMITDSVHPNDGYGKPALIEVSEWLKDNGYSKGMATFWNSNVVTEFSDGSIEMWTSNTLTESDVDEWMQKKSHVTFPEEYFVLVEKNEYFDPTTISGEVNLEKEFSDYFVYWVER